MADRKVLNKYYPPDFDPALLPKRKTMKNRQFKVVMMLPMNIRCNTCGAYIYRGKKFNSRMETVRGEDYLGIKVYRFYMKCDNCTAEFTFKTDPKNADYVCESGAHRTFDRRKAEREESEARARADAADRSDAMRALERRTADSKQELDDLDALDELREMNARNAAADATQTFFHQRALADEAHEHAQMERDLEELRRARAAFAAGHSTAGTAGTEQQAAPRSAPGEDGADEAALADQTRILFGRAPEGAPEGAGGLPSGTSSEGSGTMAGVATELAHLFGAPAAAEKAEAPAPAVTRLVLVRRRDREGAVKTEPAAKEPRVKAEPDTSTAPSSPPPAPAPDSSMSLLCAYDSD